MNLWNSFSGMLEAEVTSADPMQVLYAIAQTGAAVHDVRSSGILAYRFTMHRKDQRRVRKACEKYDSKLEIVNRKGIYWKIHQLRTRPLLIAGILFLVFLTAVIPQNILFVRTEGNESIPEIQILSEAELAGIRFGAPRREVRSEEMKNRLLSRLPQLRWAGINTYGCTAVISVREDPEEPTSENESGIGHVVASRDGYIQSATATSGTLLCQPGQTVMKGQLLISGYTDCGILIRTAVAEGEIRAETNRNIRSVIPSEHTFYSGYGVTKKKYGLLIGKKRINFCKDSGIWDMSCGRMYKEYYLTLPGGHRLPIALTVDSCQTYRLSMTSISEEDARNCLVAFSDGYLTGQMIAGTVLSRNDILEQQDGVYCLNSTFRCSEIIGKLQREEIGE